MNYKNQSRMDLHALLYLGILFSTSFCCAQGVFNFGNSFARTRIGSADGPLAGSNIVGQAFVGLAPDSLAPLGSLHSHYQGWIGTELITVPGAPPLSYVQVQMAAWDGSVWGISLATVPPDQIGRTDVVPVQLVFSWQPWFDPKFTQPAVVPLVPEPSVFPLGLLGASFLWFCRWRWRRPSTHCAVKATTPG